MHVFVFLWCPQDGRTAIHHAILHGVAENDLDIVKLLLGYGANVNVKDEVRAHECTILENTRIIPNTALRVSHTILIDVTESTCATTSTDTTTSTEAWVTWHFREDFYFIAYGSPEEQFWI